MLDSGALFHATLQRDFFENYVPDNLGKAYLGNEQSCDIVGKCVVKIKLSRSIWELKSIIHISYMKKKLNLNSLISQ